MYRLSIMAMAAWRWTCEDVTWSQVVTGVQIRFLRRGGWCLFVQALYRCSSCVRPTVTDLVSTNFVAPLSEWLRNSQVSHQIRGHDPALPNSPGTGSCPPNTQRFTTARFGFLELLPDPSFSELLHK